jgi:hypothetical protein
MPARMLLTMAPLCLGLTLLLVACSKTPATTSKPQSPGSPQPRTEMGVPDEPPPKPVVENKPFTSRDRGRSREVDPPPKPVTENQSFTSAEWARIQNLPYAEQVSTLQSLLLKRINTLSNDQTDSACLILQIIPSESVFDQSIKPRQKLLDYVRQLNTVDGLMDIEKAINYPRG